MSRFMRCNMDAAVPQVNARRESSQGLCRAVDKVKQASSPASSPGVSPGYSSASGGGTPPKPAGEDACATLCPSPWQPCDASNGWACAPAENRANSREERMKTNHLLAIAALTIVLLVAGCA